MEQTVLLALAGQSPAVITETAWALAHENPPRVPDRVIAVTTSQGRRALVSGLLEPRTPGGLPIWHDLRQNLVNAGRASADALDFGNNGASIRVLTARQDGERSDLDDLRTAAHHEEAADQMLEIVRGLTDNPDIRLVASLAGGRKTMTALLYACLSLVGRETDRLVHVLVSEPYDQKLQPAFYFPAQSDQELRFKDRTVLARDAHIELVTVPFVPLRNRWGKQMPGNFMATVDRLRNEVLPPRFTAICKTREVLFDEGRVILAPKQFALFLFFAERALQQLPPYASWPDALPSFVEWLRRRVDENCFGTDPDHRGDLVKWVAGWTADDKADHQKLTRVWSATRKKLESSASRSANALAQKIPVWTALGLDVPPECVSIQ